MPDTPWCSAALLPRKRTPSLPLGFSSKQSIEPHALYMRHNVLRLHDAKSTTSVLAPKFDCGHQTRQLYGTLHKLSSATNLPFALASGFSSTASARSKALTPASQRLLETIEVLFPEWLALHRHHDLHPLLRETAKFVFAFDRGMGPRVMDPYTDGSLEASCRKGNDLCRRFVSCLEDPTLAPSIKAFERNAQNRYATTLEALNQALSKKSRVTLVRLGLHGIGGYMFMAPQYPHLGTFHELAEDMYRRRNAWLNALKDRYKKSLLDGVWRVDYDPVMGFEVQVLLAFNGHRHENETELRQQLGALWLDTDKQNDRSAWSERVYENAEGLCHWHQGYARPPEADRFTKQLAIEFCFSDLYARLRLPGGMRSFGQVRHGD